MKHKASHVPIAEEKWKLSPLEQLFRQSRLFTWQLRGEKPLLPLPVLSDLWRGDAQKGARIANGDLPFPVDCEEYACCGWVRDLREYGGKTARQQARTMLARTMLDKWRQDQVSSGGVSSGGVSSGGVSSGGVSSGGVSGGGARWSPLAWRPDIIGHRLSNLVLTYGWFGVSADEEFQMRFAEMIAMQSRCLSMDWHRLKSGFDQLCALKGLILSQIMIPRSAAPARQMRDMTALLDLLIPRLQAQIYLDGGHKSRQPERHIEVMKLILECRVAMAYLGFSDMPAMLDILHKMTAITKMWRHGSGEFAHFQFAGNMPASEIEQILGRGGQRRVTHHAPDTGFIRLSAARTILIMDAGIGEMGGETFDAPCSLFAFEMSVGQNLFIVNSGQTAAEARLNKALCQTSAHTAMTLDGLDNCHAQTRVIALEVGPADGGMLIDGCHDGYLKSHGVLHHRQIFLAKTGGNLRGRDRLDYTGEPGQIPAEAIVRFHLHPRVSAARLKSNQILLKIGGTNQKTGWIFKAKGGTVGLDNSVYMDRQTRLSCQQITVRCPADHIQTTGELVIGWAFTRHNG